MIWTIDTGVRGPAGCTDPDDLRLVLEENMNHVGQTAAEAAAAAVMRQASPDDFRDQPKLLAIQARAEKAKKLVEARLPGVREQMKVGIDAACMLMKSTGSACTATVRGHLAASHPSGVANRIQVSVDTILPFDEEPELSEPGP